MNNNRNKYPSLLERKEKLRFFLKFNSLKVEYANMSVYICFFAKIFQKLLIFQKYDKNHRSIVNKQNLSQKKKRVL